MIDWIIKILGGIPAAEYAERERVWMELIPDVSRNHSLTLNDYQGYAEKISNDDLTRIPENLLLLCSKVAMGCGVTLEEVAKSSLQTLSEINTREALKKAGQERER